MEKLIIQPIDPSYTKSLNKFTIIQRSVFTYHLLVVNKFSSPSLLRITKLRLHIAIEVA